MRKKKKRCKKKHSASHAQFDAGCISSIFYGGKELLFFFFNSLGSLSLNRGPTGRTVPHGSEKNLPEAEAHIQVRHGKNAPRLSDIGPL